MSRHQPPTSTGSDNQRLQARLGEAEKELQQLQNNQPFSITWYLEGVAGLPTFEFTCPIGTYLFWESACAWASAPGNYGLRTFMDGTEIEQHFMAINQASVHLQLDPIAKIVSLSAGKHKITYSKSAETLNFDASDHIHGFLLRIT